MKKAEQTLTPAQQEKMQKLEEVLREEKRAPTLQEVGDTLGLTRMRICQIEKYSLNKLGELLLNTMPEQGPIDIQAYDKRGHL